MHNVADAISHLNTKVLKTEDVEDEIICFNICRSTPMGMQTVRGKFMDAESEPIMEESRIFITKRDEPLDALITREEFLKL